MFFKKIKKEHKFLSSFYDISVPYSISKSNELVLIGCLTLWCNKKKKVIGLHNKGSCLDLATCPRRVIWRFIHKDSYQTSVCQMKYLIFKEK